MNFQKVSLSVFFALGSTLASCGGDANSDDSSAEIPKTEAKSDPSSANILKIGDKDGYFKYEFQVHHPVEKDKWSNE